MIAAPPQARSKVTRTRKSNIKALVLLAMACCLALDLAVAAQKKPKPTKEEITQTLQLPKELPGAVIGETRHLTFHVTPLSARGLLSAQVRDALKAQIGRASSRERD